MPGRETGRNRRHAMLGLLAAVAVLVPTVAATSTGAVQAAPLRVRAVTAAAPATVHGTRTSTAKKTTANLTFPATGYFRTAQADGRWWLVTPTGQPFYADGVDHVSAAGDIDQVTLQCPYCQTIAADYPSTSAWDTATLTRLRSWGVNTLGPYSDDSTLGTQMPYEVQLSMASGDDWFAPSFVTHADAVAAADVAPLADDPNVIGFFTDSELTWGPPGTSDLGPILDTYLDLPAGSPGLAVAQQYIGNPAGFLYALATRYFQVTTAAVRMYDTHHLILGVKAEGQEIQPELLEAAAPYINVFSINDYQLQPGFEQAVDKIWPYYLPVDPNLADMEQYFNGPMMIGEYAFIAPGPATPNLHPGIYYVSANQQQRADDYANFVAPLYEDAPWVVGDDWFEYVDEPVNGRPGDNEDDNFGLVNVEDQPYTDVVDAQALMHSIAPDRLVQTGPECDSWSEGSGGAVCTATLPVTTPPVTIIDEPLPSATQGTAYSTTVYAGGGRPPYTFSVAAGSLPRGLKLDKKTGVISGTPTRPGTSSFTLAVEDAGKTGPEQQAESISVGPGTPVAVKTATLANARQGASYAKSLAATGGTPPYTWSVTGGALPPGLTLSAGGTISGTPLASGTYAFRVQATDSSTPTGAATASLTLEVRP